MYVYYYISKLSWLFINYLINEVRFPRAISLQHLDTYRYNITKYTIHYNIIKRNLTLYEQCRVRSIYRVIKYILVYL